MNKLLNQIKNIVNNTPNNMLLGKKIRILMDEAEELEAQLDNNPDDGSWKHR